MYIVQAQERVNDPILFATRRKKRIDETRKEEEGRKDEVEEMESE